MYKAEELNPRSNRKIGMIENVCGFNANPFQKRYDNHKSSLAHEVYRHKTSLSIYVGEVKKRMSYRSYDKMGNREKM